MRMSGLEAARRWTEADVNVGDLARRSVVVARGDEHILEAARRMRDEHVGCLVGGRHLRRA